MLILRQYKTRALAALAVTQPGTQVRFRLVAKLADGHPVWRGWFDSRDDADAFLFSLATGVLAYEPAIWDLPSPGWRPGMGEQLSYEFSTVVFVTSGTTYTIPNDFTSVNTFECLGAGGAGGLSYQLSGATNAKGAGGGGGAYSIKSNLSYTRGQVVTIQVGIGGAGISAASTVYQTTAGPAGTATWFDGASLAASVVGADFGRGGAATTTADCAGGVGGATANGVGTTKAAGGKGGTITGTTWTAGTGGGGGGGPHGAGNAGGDLATTSASNGGSGDAGSGGAGGTLGNLGSPGGNGTNWDSTHGVGGGGGGGAIATGTNSGGGAAGGNYGAGGGGGGIKADTASQVSGSGTNGLLIVTYTPRPFTGFNLSMLGM